MNVYRKLDLTKIRNVSNINGKILEKFRNAFGNIENTIPYLWGTIGIAINEDIINKVFGNLEIDSYDILLNPSNIQKLYKYGVSFPDEFIDIFPQTMQYLGLNPNTRDKSDIKPFIKHFAMIRKYITKFSSTTIINDLLDGSVCIGIGSSDNITRAIRASNGINKRLKYIIPRIGGLLWIDCMCVPKSAPHPENAFKFINYLLDSKVSRRISEYSGASTTSSDQNTDQNIENLLIGTPSFSKSDNEFDKLMTRRWSQVKVRDFDMMRDESF
ncbi:MAG: extracellular solute-binding protein [Holosporales bacterium]|jgi:putrescine transport system substrate-binding protein|nr:extracellular solute-binding protein [Holosporales bacterium]